MNPSPHEPPLHPSELNLTARVRSFVRFVAFLIIGVTGTLAWQSYGGPARETIASWSSHLGWLAPAAAPAGTAPERLKAMSLALAAVRQDIDKLAAELRKLQAQGTADGTAASASSRQGSQRR